jgi:hypothetical protein
LYCILDDTEWRHWRSWPTTEVLQCLEDEQGAPIVLVRLAGAVPGIGGDP